jgi:hypothetical protein
LVSTILPIRWRKLQVQQFPPEEHQTGHLINVPVGCMFITTFSLPFCCVNTDRLPALVYSFRGRILDSNFFKNVYVLHRHAQFYDNTQLLLIA